MIKRSLLIFIVLLINVIYSNLYAHPHVFIISNININFGTNGINGFDVRWTFDSMFTEIMLDEYDENSDGEFDKSEIENLYKKAFINLKKSGYFTHIYIGDDKININTISNFKASIKDGEMIYSFFIPIKIDINNNPQDISIYCYDGEYYMDIMMDEEKPLSYTNSSVYNIEYTIAEDPRKAYYFEQIYPQVIRIKTQRK